MSFDYSGCADPIRRDLVEAHQEAWEHIASAGTWLSGAERVAIAEETRRARQCALCAARKEALSPFAVDGEHDHGGVLAATIVDAVHRVTTDDGRLTEKWYRSLLADGLSAESYVEALGVTVLAISVDAFHHAIGLAPEPLPTPRDGEPTRERPDDVQEGEAWVPMASARYVARLAGLPAGQAPYVLRALSLVPEQLRAWRRLSSAQYLTEDQMTGFQKVRSIDRSQIELIAGRVSALHECFY